MRLPIIMFLVGCEAAAQKLTSLSERESLLRELDAALGDRSAWILPERPEDGDWSAFPQADANPLTDAKVALGQALFYDPGLGSDETQLGFHEFSCATCHNPEGGFGSGSLPGRGIGAGGEGRGIDRAVAAGVSIDEVDLALVNDMRLVNLAWRASAAGWGGVFDPSQGILPEGIVGYDGADGLELFVEVALSAHHMMPREEREVSAGSAIYDEAYADLLVAAYPEVAEAEGVTTRQVAWALSAYIRSIVTANAPFQRFLRMDLGEDAEDVPLSDEALRGAALFFGDGRCSSCHEGPALSSEGYSAVGARAYDETTQIPGYIPDDPQGEDGWGTVAQLFGPAISDGRYNATGDLADWGRYAIPSVYDAGAPGVTGLGHGAANADLHSMVRHLTGGPDPALNPTLDVDMVPYLDPILFGDGGALLDDEQVDAIVTFIEEGLTDGDLELADTPEGLSQSGYCAITNDPLSREATPGCEAAREP